MRLTGVLLAAIALFTWTRSACAFVPPYVREWGTFGIGTGQLNSPRGAALSPDEQIVYVVDTNNNRVQMFSPHGTYISQWGGLGSGPGQFSAPTGIVVGQNGKVYVTDVNNNRVQVFEANGSYVGQFGTLGSGPGNLNFPIGIALDEEDNVYVADVSNDRIQKFNASGTWLGEFGDPGTGLGLFQEIWGVAWVPQEDPNPDLILVTDHAQQVVHAFSEAGVPHFLWGEFGSGPGQWDQPRGIASSGKSIFVTDAVNGRIHCFAVSSTGATPCAMWGSNGSGPGQFISPLGITVSPTGAIYVPDKENHRVQKFGCDGAPITWGNPAGGLWSVPSNWGQQRVPSRCDHVVLGPGTYSVTLDTDVYVRSFTIEGVGIKTLVSATNKKLFVEDLNTAEGAAIQGVDVQFVENCPEVCENCPPPPPAEPHEVEAPVVLRGSTITHDGDIQVKSDLTLQGPNNVINADEIGVGNLVELADLIGEGHVCCGAGRSVVNADITNQRVVEIGFGESALAAAVRINGDFTQVEPGQLVIEVGGTIPGDTYGILSVSGTAQLDGVLKVVAVNGFAPTLGTQFEVLRYGSRQGQFAAYGGLAFPNGLQYIPIYGDTSLVLQVVNPQVSAPEPVSTPGVMRLSCRNPALREAEITLESPVRTIGTLRVLDSQGREVAVLLEGSFEGGTTRFRWDGRNASGAPAAAGVYFVQWRTPEKTLSTRVTLLR